MMKRLMIMSLIVSMFLIGCRSEQKSVATKITTIMAAKESPIKELYFSGSIQPIKTDSILSPVDGDIEKLNFVYGQSVQKGQVLVVINSLKLMDDFRQAVNDYLTKKSSYLNQIKSYEGSKVLHDAGVIDDENFETAENQYETSVLDFFQQEYQLQKVLEKAGVSADSIEKLNITDTDKVKLLFAKKFNHIKIYSPTTGVALFPVPGQSQDTGGDSGADSSIEIGKKIHEDQLLLSVGNLSGFSITMTIDEIDVNSIKQGMNAVITGNAFPGISLNGKVVYVASQAQPSTQGASTTSTFTAIIEVPAISDKVRAVVHVGMSTKILISIKEPPRILLPIDCVFQKNDQSYVTIVQPDGSQQDVMVVTGGTTVGKVIIVSGINVGQKVIVRD